MSEELEFKKIALEQTHITAIDFIYPQRYANQNCCKKSNCCEKYKKKGKHCKKCPKK